MFEFNYENLQIAFRWLFFGGFIYLLYSISLIWRSLATPKTKERARLYIRLFGGMMILGFALGVVRMFVEHPVIVTLSGFYFSVLVIWLAAYIHSTVDGIKDRVTEEELNELFALMDKTIWQMKHSPKQ